MPFTFHLYSINSHFELRNNPFSSCAANFNNYINSAILVQPLPQLLQLVYSNGNLLKYLFIKSPCKICIKIKFLFGSKTASNPKLLCKSRQSQKILQLERRLNKILAQWEMQFISEEKKFTWLPSDLSRTDAKTAERLLFLRCMKMLYCQHKKAPALLGRFSLHRNLSHISLLDLREKEN